MKREFRDMLKERGREELPQVLLVSAECAPLSKTGGLRMWWAHCPRP